MDSDSATRASLQQYHDRAAVSRQTLSRRPRSQLSPGGLHTPRFSDIPAKDLRSETEQRPTGEPGGSPVSGGTVHPCGGCVVICRVGRSPRSTCRIRDTAPGWPASSSCTRTAHKAGRDQPFRGAGSLVDTPGASPTHVTAPIDLDASCCRAALVAQKAAFVEFARHVHPFRVHRLRQLPVARCGDDRLLALRAGQMAGCAQTHPTTLPPGRVLHSLHSGHRSVREWGEWDILVARHQRSGFGRGGGSE